MSLNTRQYIVRTVTDYSRIKLMIYWRSDSDFPNLLDFERASPAAVCHVQSLWCIFSMRF